MLLGFISLLLSVSQSKIAKICIPKDLSEKFLPCNKPKDDKPLKDTSHFQFSFTGRHLLAGDSAVGDYCTLKVFTFFLVFTFLGQTQDLSLFVFFFILHVFSILLHSQRYMIGFEDVHRRIESLTYIVYNMIIFWIIVLNSGKGTVNVVISSARASYIHLRISCFPHYFLPIDYSFWYHEGNFLITPYFSNINTFVYLQSLLNITKLKS